MIPKYLRRESGLRNGVMTLRIRMVSWEVFVFSELANSFSTFAGHQDLTSLFSFENRNLFPATVHINAIDSPSNDVLNTLHDDEEEIENIVLQKKIDLKNQLSSNLG